MTLHDDALVNSMVWYRWKPQYLTIILHCNQKVQRGTNGGVTLQGLFAAAVGGGIIGLAYAVTELLTASCSSETPLRQFLVIPVATAAGLSGSVIDSLLGATVQFSGFCSIRQKVLPSPLTLKTLLARSSFHPMDFFFIFRFGRPVSLAYASCSILCFIDQQRPSPKQGMAIFSGFILKKKRESRNSTESLST